MYFVFITLDIYRFLLRNFPRVFFFLMFLNNNSWILTIKKLIIVYLLYFFYNSAYLSFYMKIILLFGILYTHQSFIVSKSKITRRL